MISQRYGVDTRTVDVYGIPQNIETMEAEDVKKELGTIHDNVKTITIRMAEVLDKTQNKEQTQPPAQTQSKQNKNRKER